MRLKVDLDVKEALKDIKEYQLKAKKEVKDLVSETAINIERIAKKNVLVDTGQLRASIRLLHKTFDGTGAEVGTDVKHGPVNEFIYKPFLNPAAEEERPKFNKELKKILKK